MAVIAELLKIGEEELLLHDIPEPRREAASLLCFALQKDRTFLYAYPEQAVSPEQMDLYSSLVARRAAHEPFHYITGSKEFFGLEFEVSPAVLIPRPETEMLVERGIKRLSDKASPSFCEVGVGSGCISAALLVNVPAARGVGLELSEEAIGVASRNLEKHGVTGRFDLRSSDVFSSLGEDERFDLIVSNPPYVPKKAIEGLQAEVRFHEPHTALTDGADGLSVIRRIIAGAARFLEPGGSILLEIGMGQSEEVLRMFEADIWQYARVEADFQGIPRVVDATLRN